MKNLILILLMFICNSLLGQEKKDSIDPFPDFSKHDTLNKTTIDTTLKFFPDSWADPNIVTIESDSQMIAVRRYFPDSKIIHKEYIKVDKNTYHYLENDSLNDNRRMAEGKLIVSNDIFVDNDTILRIDPNTFETTNLILKYPKLLKEGKWFEADSVFIYHGSYKNDKREGNWLKMKRKWEEYDQRELAYKNGILISENQFNLVKSGNINDVKKGLIGTWYLKHNSGETDSLFVFSRTIGNSKASFRFNSDNSFKLGRLSQHSLEPLSIDTWSINEKFKIKIGRDENHYQILMVLEDMLVLKIIKK